ncbi:bifunctional metallophosphatase/5'-nucleotidase [Pyxidicoccus fallax]|uniref:Bifunctional metallophosphatase/5'-nucleotidase n=1 Tax=Pyxidicoccus fallax TaxID=394095 RepID=A0A848LUB3_9BACT|nr:5'-nucleotidase C-terminal domain-containing protein [Pyxidicoccus fallax]NMO20944.1 bifunctional metallophosphatase/5'-nucleotidase [Pyxidicoccus fallax]NPC78039.1 bifunctional metallophosphatase/5'-nucleotidase [Pyxidicoccus fallax]
MRSLLPVRTLRTFALCLAGACSLLTACGSSTDEEPVKVPAPTGDFSPRTITLLQTSDLHTNIFPWDYFTGRPDARRGLAKVATLVQQERAKNPDCTLLFDTGDTIQGTPLGTYYSLVDNAPKHPMATAMNELGYTAMALGNHEFNYGLGVLEKFKSEVNFPLLGANVRHTSDGSEAFTPYVLQSVCGVKVGILGLVTPGVTTWERPENIPGLRFDDPLETAKVYVPKMKAAGATVIIVAIHSGPDKQPTGSASNPASWLADYADPTKWADRGSLPGENEAVQIAQEVPGVDVLLTGHTHQPIPKMLLKNKDGREVLLTQPNRWGSHLATVQLKVTWNAGVWGVGAHDSQLLAVDEKVAEDPTVTRLTQQYHDTTVAYVNQKIGSTTATFPGGFAARYVDSPLADLINTVQEEAAHEAGHDVDLSLAAIFTNDGALPAGDITLRDAYSIYIYDNTLYVMEINGSILRRALEMNANYFAQLDANALPERPEGAKATAPSVPDFNWDIYSRVDYGYDLTKPAGSRLTHLRFNGRDVTDDQVFRVALNNYRGGGGGGYDMFKEGRVLWTSADGVRDYIARYLQAHPGLAPDAVNTCNFSLAPDLYGRYFQATLGPAKCAEVR